jgi:hypothetical protein
MSRPHSRRGIPAARRGETGKATPRHPEGAGQVSRRDMRGDRANEPAATQLQPERPAGPTWRGGARLSRGLSPRTPGSNVALRWLCEEVRNAHPQECRHAYERAHCQVLAAGLDALKVLDGHASGLRELLLGHGARRAKLRHAPPEIVENVVRSHRRHRRWCTRVRLIKTHTRQFVFMDGVRIDGPRRLGRGASRM